MLFVEKRASFEVEWTWAHQFVIYSQSYTGGVLSRILEIIEHVVAAAKLADKVPTGSETGIVCISLSSWCANLISRLNTPSLWSWSNTKSFGKRWEILLRQCVRALVHPAGVRYPSGVRRPSAQPEKDVMNVLLSSSQERGTRLFGDVLRRLQSFYAVSFVRPTIRAMTRSEVCHVD